MTEPRNRWKKIRSTLASAFKVEEEGTWEPSARQKEIIEKLAGWVVNHRLTLPATMTLESLTPLNFLGARHWFFFNRLSPLFSTPADYKEFQEMLEYRQSIQIVIGVLEAREEAFLAGSESSTGRPVARLRHLKTANRVPSNRTTRSDPMNRKPEDIKVIIATDCGSTTTKAILIQYDEEKGEYRQTHRGEAPTTVESPFEDVTMGVLNSVQELAELSGRKVAGRKQPDHQKGG